MLKRWLIPVVIVLSMFAFSACSPTDVSLQHFPRSEWSKARCIVRHESGGNPRATGGAGERGLYQIHPVHKSSFQRVTGRSWSDAYEPGPNGQYAAYLWRQQGWRPWTTSRLC